MPNKFISLDNIKVVWKNIHERFQRLYAITTFDLNGLLSESNSETTRVDVLQNEKTYYINGDTYEYLIEYLTTGLFDKTLEFGLRKFSVLSNFIYQETLPEDIDIDMADIILIDDAKNIYNFKITFSDKTSLYSIKVILNKIIYSKNDVNDIKYNITESYLGDWTLDTCPLDMTVPPQTDPNIIPHGTKKPGGSSYAIGSYRYYGQSSNCTFVIDKPTTYYLIDSYNQNIDVYIIKLKKYFSNDTLVNPGFTSVDFIENIKISYDTLVKNKIDITTLPQKKDSSGNPIEDQYLLDGLIVKSTDNIYQFTINPEFIFGLGRPIKNSKVQYALSIFRRSADGDGVRNQYVKLAERPYIK